MEEDYIKKIIEDNYLIKVWKIEKIKNTYRINGDEGYGLKIIKYEYPHFCFIYGAIEHLIKKGLDSIIPFEKTKDGLGYIKIENNYCYLTKWIKSRSSNYSDLNEVIKISKELGKFHKATSGFVITPNMKPRIFWDSWITTFETRKNEILDFKHRISQKAYLNDFDIKYRDNIEKEIERANKSIEGLKRSKYLFKMEEHLMNLSFCHHDLANHNILVDENGNIKFIDFDYCVLDSHLNDLASFILRVLRSNDFDFKFAKEIIKNYSEEIFISNDELEIIKEFIRFPRAFWQLGIQAYWEIQPWKIEKFNSRLDKYLNEIEKREKFIEEFF